MKTKVPLTSTYDVTAGSERGRAQSPHHERDAPEDRSPMRVWKPAGASQHKRKKVHPHIYSIMKMIVFI